MSPFLVKRKTGIRSLLGYIITNNLCIVHDNNYIMQECDKLISDGAIHTNK